MSNSSRRVDDPDELRQRALAVARERAAQAPVEGAPRSAEEIQHTLHELQVHQIELEMQNEELRRAQAELDASRARYVDLYDQAPVGYSTVSEPGLILEANLTTATLLGADRGELFMQPITRFIAHDDQDTYYHHRRHLFATGAPQSCELRIQRTDGTSFWAHLVATATHEADGAPSSRVTLSDISALKRAEEEREVLQAHLAQAQKTEAVGQLAGGIAHDFNNILAGMIMQLDMLMMSQNVPAQELRQALTDLMHSANRAADLTKQLLLFSSQQPPQTARRDLNALIAELLKLLGRQLGERIALTVECSNEPLWIECDAVLIEQMVTNLCANARYAMPEGGRLTIATHLATLGADTRGRVAAARPGQFACLRVTDTGCGMNLRVLTHMFEPFFTTKPQGQGTGLGLATVHGIVIKHGGWIEVESQPGHGATFAVYLPTATPTETRAPAITRDSPRRGTERILLVEDHHEVRRVAARCLRALGYRVTEAVTGVEALAVWARESGGTFDLLLTDMVMPGGVSGLDLCIRLREARPNLKTIISSGYSTAILDGEEKKIRSPEVFFLPKPYDVVTLASAVRDCLDQPA